MLTELNTALGLYNSGIAGGGFALIRMPNNTYQMVDFREKAPLAATEDMFKDDPMGSKVGGRASRMLMVNVRSGVPGQLRGLEYIYKTYGSKNVSWSDLFQPAIEVANVGWNVTNDILVMMDWALNGTMNSTDPKHNFFLQPAWKPDFAPNGTLVKEGDIIMRKRYAKTLQRMARPDGVNDFYNGSIADSIIRAINANQGIMTKDDLKNYTIAIRKTNQMKYRNYTLTSTTTPSCGSVVLNVLGVLNKYANYSIKPGQDNVNIHRMVESIKFAYGYRMSFGDPDYTRNITLLEKTMLSDSRLTRIKHGINDTYVHTNVSFYDPDHKWTKAPHGTSHMVAADNSGLAISLTTTVNLPFGSHVMTDNGIVLNDQMDVTENSMGYPASPNNFIKPGKRPLSSISPVIATRPDGSIAFVTGSAGGSRIPTAVIQSLIHALDEDEAPQKCLDIPRLHHQLFPNVLEYAANFDKPTISWLNQTHGHVIGPIPRIASAAQAISRSVQGLFRTGSEPSQVLSGGYGV
ncbi:hypothetical protein VI817_005607 [Penicillium citrinum]|nr:hypothetical protein VI817_005607 [Penicillium citrinum]